MEDCIFEIANICQEISRTHLYVEKLGWTDDLTEQTCEIELRKKKTKESVFSYKGIGENAREKGWRQALASIIRPDFDLYCNCGFYFCKDCGKPWYPMELDCVASECPDCLGKLTELFSR